MRRLEVTAAERKRLRFQLQQTDDARVYRRTLAVLQVVQGQPILKVAALVRMAPRSVWRWLERYAAKRDPRALADAPGRGRPRLWQAEHRTYLRLLVQESPQTWGYPHTQWTVPLLTEHLKGRGVPSCSEDTLRRCLHELDLVWKRPRYILDPDPEKEKKTPHPSPAQPSYPPPCRAVSR